MFEIDQIIFLLTWSAIQIKYKFLRVQKKRQNVKQKIKMEATIDLKIYKQISGRQYKVENSVRRPVWM